MILSQAFHAQADACIALDSPFMGQLLHLLGDHWPEGTALDDRISAFDGDIGPSGHFLPLRIAGGLHALVLNQMAPDLAAVYPPASPADDALLQTLLVAMDTHKAFLLDWIESPPQTNEVRRSAALIAGAQVAVQHFDLPLRISELGASGGLNLMWDHYALEISGHRYGPDMPALTLTPDWTGPLPPHGQPQIAERAGVDLNPLDPSRADHLMRLMAYLWADQPHRLQITRAAASVMDVTVTKGDAIDWLSSRLPEAPEGQLHLIQNTVAWQYFPPDVQARGKAMIFAAGARATENRPLAWLTLESDGSTPGAALTLRLWPGDLTLELGRADYHGRWINWTCGPAN